MRLALALLALCTAGLSTTARAERLPYTLSGTVDGLRESWLCDLEENPSCGPTYSDFSRSFAITLFLDLEPGPNEFIYGSYRTAFGMYEGTILLADDGNLIGLNGSWAHSTCFPDFPQGCFTIGGTAPTFTVQRGNGVPEPSTWLMMLVGFGLVGSWLRVSSARSGARRPA